MNKNVELTIKQMVASAFDINLHNIIIHDGKVRIIAWGVNGTKARSILKVVGNDKVDYYAYGYTPIVFPIGDIFK